MKKSAGLYLSAREASAELAISPATLYAYVSRGLIRSEPSTDSRSHRYRAEDVRGLKERRAPSPEPRGLKSFDADLPVMDSSISTITEDGPIYRGVNCIDLAEADTLEHAATLLWDVTGVDPFDPDNCPDVSDEMRAVADAARNAAPIDRTIAVLALAASADPRAFTRAADGRAMVGGRILRLVIATMLNRPSSAAPLHLKIAKAWAPEHQHAADLIRRALVLLADHELNASTFAARVAVSTGASLAAGTLAGLAALTGPLHGDASTGVFAVIERVRAIGAGDAVREWLGQGRPVPAFGHRLYPAGDIRAIELLGRFELPPAYRDLRDAVEEHAGERPNIDFALAALTDIHHLPKEAPITIFALARTVGWLAHLLEQVASGQLIRPRARYVGPPVALSDARQAQV